jgi:hypothetical protein
MAVIWVVELKCGKDDVFEPMMNWCYPDRKSARSCAKSSRRDRWDEQDQVRVRKYVREEPSK